MNHIYFFALIKEDIILCGYESGIIYIGNEFHTEDI